MSNTPSIVEAILAGDAATACSTMEEYLRACCRAAAAAARLIPGLESAERSRRADALRIVFIPLGELGTPDKGGSAMTKVEPALTVEELQLGVALGQPDTVALTIVDMQGRLQGNDCSGEYFVDEVLDTPPRAATTCSRSMWR